MGFDVPAFVSFCDADDPGNAGATGLAENHFLFGHLGVLVVLATLECDRTIFRGSCISAGSLNGSLIRIKLSTIIITMNVHYTKRSVSMSVFVTFVHFWCTKVTDTFCNSLIIGKI